MDEHRDFDCLDFKLMLTALVDGAAPPEGRQTAERHALACSSCLKLLEEAESTDFMLRLSARAAPAELPKDFADRVVAAARREDDERVTAALTMRGRSWREGVAWLAAAAGLAIAVAVWNISPRESGRMFSSSAAITPIASPVFSGVRELTDDDRRSALDAERDAVRTESLALLLTSIAGTLDEIVAADASDRAALDAIALKARQNELAARASLLRIALPPEQRADLQAAEAALMSLSAGCLDLARAQELQSNLRSLGLAQRLRELALRLPRALAAA